MNKQQQIVIAGIMSGTSLDGLDVAFCRFFCENEKYDFEILAAQTIAYDDDLRKKLGTAHLLDAVEFSKLHNEFGNFIGKQILHLADKFKITPHYIASHGHTVIHQPEKQLTVQIGNGAVIAAQTRINTVCDFRTADVAQGGQGAPLVPFGDIHLFNQYDAALNLGGFSNISIIKNKPVTAFDISPVNIVLNSLAKNKGHEFDMNGNMAASGKINADLLSNLIQINNNQSKHKVSLSREWVEQHINPILHNTDTSIFNLLRTFTEYAAISIAQVMNDFNIKTCLVTGGGALNAFLLDCIRTHTSTQIVLPEKQIIEFKEAIIFAFLGLRRIQEKINVLSSVTGASRDTSSGIIWKA